jgi:ABC-type transport system involved in multi-copper enzyme maturation permease subunit
MGTPDLIRSVAVVFQLGLIVLVVPALTVGAITQELERGNLDLLRQTRLTAWQWLTGKLWTAGVFVLFVVVGALPLWFSIYYLKTNTVEQILVAGRLMGSTVVLALTTGLLGSALARRTATATGIAYGVLALITVVSLTPLLLGDRMTAAARDAVLTLNPFASAIQAVTTEYFNESRELWRTHLKTSLGLSGVFLLIAAERMRRLLLPQR